MAKVAEAMEKAKSLYQAGQLGEAERIYRQILKSAPDNADAWCYLGMVLHDQGRIDEAIAVYRQAIQRKSNFPVAYNNLGNSFRMTHRIKEAVECYDQAIAQKPGYLNAHKNKGTALVWEGHLDEAADSYQAALRLRPNDGELHKNLGVIWLLQGKFAEGWREYEWRWRTDEAVSLDDYNQPIWDGSSLDGKTILLTAEQGLGDTIQFVRYAAVLKQRYDCRVIVGCQKVLLPLLQSLEQVDQLIDQNSKPLPKHDCYCPLVSVPGVLVETADSVPAEVPYITPEPEIEAQWCQRLSSNDDFRIGITWQGNPQNQADQKRSFPLKELLPLAKLNGVRLFSLQKNHGTDQLPAVAGRIDVVDLGQSLDEGTGAFVETAAVLKNLDLVITADTAVAHLAGAMGVPVWVALPYVPDWRWLLDRSDSPWYPTMRLFRQEKVGDWAGVFHRIANCLTNQSTKISAKRPDQYLVAGSRFNRLISARHGMMLVNGYDQYIGKSIELYGEFSEGEVDLFSQLVRKGAVVVDAGANIGALTLPLARMVGPRGMVYAFEPQRMVFQTLCANMALNSIFNVQCIPKAVGANTGLIKVPALDFTKESNFGGMSLGGPEQGGDQVAVATIDELYLERLDFLKADVEGMERQVIEGAVDTIARCRPILYVENDRKEHSPALIELIASMGYDMYWHFSPLFHSKNFFNNPENAFGQIVSMNMLCVHSSVESTIQGLKRVEVPSSD